MSAKARYWLWSTWSIVLFSFALFLFRDHNTDWWCPSGCLLYWAAESAVNAKRADAECKL